MTWKSELFHKFGDRATDDKIERKIYARDLAETPKMLRRVVDTTPEAVAQPVNVDEILYLIELSQKYGVALTPRGAGTSGFGEALPANRGIVVDFSRMDKILAVNAKEQTVKVRPGVVLKDLENELHKHGLALRSYPTSLPSATAGGWVATNGAGVGSFEYGAAGESVISMEVVTPVGEVKTVTGEEKDVYVGTEGVLGFITAIELKVRKLEKEVPLLVTFANNEDLQAFMNKVVDLPLWHVSFSSREFVANQNRAKKEDEIPDNPLALVVFPASRALDGDVARIAESCGGRMLAKDLAEKEWQERFYPMRQKVLGPSLIPAEAIGPVAHITDILGDISKQVGPMGIEGTMVNKSEAALLGFLLSDARTLSYTLDQHKPIVVLEIAKKYGGRSYGNGLYFADEAKNVLGEEKYEKVKKLKEIQDARGLFNPCKITQYNKLLSFAKDVAKNVKPMAEVLSRRLKQEGKPGGDLDARLANAAYVCSQCGFCKNECTLYKSTRWESYSPRGKFIFLKDYMEGSVKFNQDMVNKFLLCTTCKRCDNVCQVNLPIQDLWDELRGELIQKRDFATFRAFEMMGASVKDNRNIWAGPTEERDAWVPEDVTYKEKGEILYWAGCTASYVEDNISANAMRLLNAAGEEFAYMGKEENCCGVPMFVAGKWDVFGDIFKYNMEQLRKRGVKKVVLSCPGCYVAWSHAYPKWAKMHGIEWNIEIEHISETLVPYLKDGTLKLNKEINETVTWHDPCHIGRHGGIYDAPRECIKAIPGLQFTEMEHNREDGLCCGSVLTRIGKPDAANDIGQRRLQEAEQAGVSTLLTTCPCCQVQLRIAADKTGSEVKVMDFTDYLVEALGYERPDSTDKTLEAWAVFENVLEQMETEQMAEMFKELMPGMMQHLPGWMKAAMSSMKSFPGNESIVNAMKPMIPKMVPAMIGDILPKMMPEAVELMKKRVPNMPQHMQNMLPDLLPEVMSRVVPKALPELLPLIEDKMIEEMKRAFLKKTS